MAIKEYEWLVLFENQKANSHKFILTENKKLTNEDIERFKEEIGGESKITNIIANVTHPEVCKKPIVTLEQVIEQGLEYREYEKGVYKYGTLHIGWSIFSTNSKWTLVEDGVELVSGADWVDWEEKGVYTYLKDGKWTLMVDWKELISGADCIFYKEKGVYRYYKDGKLINVTNGKEEIL